jgi:hypothetical protein
MLKYARRAHFDLMNTLDRGAGIGDRLGFRTTRVDLGNAPAVEAAMSRPGGLVLEAPLKARKRAEEKVAGEYGGDWSRLSDAARATVAVDSVGDAARFLDAMREHGVRLATRPRDRITEPSPGGWRDLGMTVRLPGGHLAELKVALKPMLLARARSQPLRDELRQLALSGGDRARMAEIEGQVRSMYERAWEAASGGPS